MKNNRQNNRFYKITQNTQQENRLKFMISKMEHTIKTKILDLKHHN